MREAIQTVYHGARSGDRPARVVASCGAGRVSVNVSECLSLDSAHADAVRVLIVQLGLYGTWVCGGSAYRRQWVCTSGPVMRYRYAGDYT